MPSVFPLGFFAVGSNNNAFCKRNKLQPLYTGGERNFRVVMWSQSSFHLDTAESVWRCWYHTLRVICPAPDVCMENSGMVLGDYVNHLQQIPYCHGIYMPLQLSFWSIKTHGVFIDGWALSNTIDCERGNSEQRILLQWTFCFSTLVILIPNCVKLNYWR